MAKEKTKSPAPKSAPAVPEKATLAFGKENYKIMLIGIAVVAIGMILMIGGASEDPNKMSEELFGTQRTIVAPIVIIAGYIVVLLAIIKKPKG